MIIGSLSAADKRSGLQVMKANIAGSVVCRPCKPNLALESKKTYLIIIFILIVFLRMHIDTCFLGQGEAGEDVGWDVSCLFVHPAKTCTCTYGFSKSRMLQE